MRIARVTGTVTLVPRLPELKDGRLVIVETLDAQAIDGHADAVPRETPMPQSLIAYDELGAAEGQLVALSEGGEATQPFRPERVPVDAYCAAILDSIDLKD
ncbi:MAG: EutN/CcmL family microcompartment protein [Planctomycetota bacterium]